MINDLSIVIVDDMHFSRALIESMLRKGGYEDIRISHNGEDALVLLENKPADIVLVDWEMPKMNGLEFTHAVREKERIDSWYTSIILITANQRSRCLEEAFLGGVDDFIYKPFQSQELLGRVYSAGRIGRQQNLLLAQTNELRNSQRDQQQLVTRDALTLLYNRDQLRQNLSEMLHQTYTRGGCACLALFDIDGLDQINESQGYDVGDMLVIELSKRLKKALRPMDFLSRYWGGTFATLIHHPDTDLDFSRPIQRILKEISKLPFNTPQGALSINCSAGAQAYQAHPTLLNANELELMALAHLNTAKQRGHNNFHVEIKKGAG